MVHLRLKVPDKGHDGVVRQRLLLGHVEQRAFSHWRGNAEKIGLRVSNHHLPSDGMDDADIHQTTDEVPESVKSMKGCTEITPWSNYVNDLKKALQYEC